MRTAAKSTTDYQLVYTTRSERQNKPLYYVVNTATGQKAQGFMILSADDLAPALLAYGNEPFELAAMPEHVKDWMLGYEQAISQGIKRGRALTTAASVGTEIGQLLSTKWSQQGSYVTLAQQKVNAALQAAGLPTIKTYTGCVATSAAQIMNYYQYPQHGVGKKTYEFGAQKKALTTDGRDTTVLVPISLTADFAASTYDWTNMANSYDYEYSVDGAYSLTNNTEAQRAAVAQLMYDCGVAVSMNYGTTGSGATTSDWVVAMPAYFNYDKGIHTEYRDYYTDQQWQQLIYDELAEGRPVLYSGKTKEGSGHAFVCDGYNGSGLFHINWGWNGHYDGYYTLLGEDALNSHGDEGDAYSQKNYVVCGIQPDKGNPVAPDVLACMGDYYAEIETKDGYTPIDPSATYPISTIYLYGRFTNHSARNMNIRMGARFVKVDDPSVSIVEPYLYNDVDLGIGYSYKQYPVTPSAIPLKGTYRIYPVWQYSDDDWTDASTWHDTRLLASTTELPVVTFGQNAQYSLQKMVNQALSDVEPGQSYALTGSLQYKGVMGKVMRDQYEVVRLGLKFVNVDDPSCWYIDPSNNYYWTSTAYGSTSYTIKVDIQTAPRKGTYRVYPVWADWYADWCVADNWHNMESLLAADVPTITYNQETPVRNATMPQVDVLSVNDHPFAFLTLNVLANQDITTPVTLTIRAYGNSEEEPNRYQFISKIQKTIDQLQRGDIQSFKDMPLIEDELEVGRKYIFSVVYAYTPAGQAQMSGDFGPHFSYAFSAEDMTTGIEQITFSVPDPSIVNLDGSQSAFDLQGRRITTPLSKGLYSIQGKKVMIR